MNEEIVRQCEIIYQGILDLINSHPNFKQGAVLHACNHVIANLILHSSDNPEEMKKLSKEMFKEISKLLNKTLDSNEKDAENILLDIEGKRK